MLLLAYHAHRFSTVSGKTRATWQRRCCGFTSWFLPQANVLVTAHCFLALEWRNGLRTGAGGERSDGEVTVGEGPGGGSRCAQLLGRSEGFWFSQLSCKIRQVTLIFFIYFFIFCLIYWGSDAFHFTPLSRHCTSLLPPFQTEKNTNNSAACNLDPRSGNGWTQCITLLLGIVLPPKLTWQDNATNTNETWTDRLLWVCVECFWVLRHLIDIDTVGMF